MAKKHKVAKRTTATTAFGASSAGDGTSMQRAGVQKRKHGAGRQQLAAQLEASKPLSAKEKLKRKRSAKSTILNAVDGLKSSIDDLIAANEVHYREQWQKGQTGGGNLALTARKRQKMVVAETEHLQQVLTHPAFVADPLAALQEHLRNTVKGSSSNSASAIAQLHVQPSRGKKSKHERGAV
jgi:hypothetical protein